MKSSYSLSLLLLLVIATVFSSCSPKAELTPLHYEEAELFGEDFLNTYYTPDILFMTLIQREDNGEIAGWFLANTGQVFTFGMEYSPLSFETNIVEETQLNLFQENAKATEVHLTADEFVPYFKQVQAIDLVLQETEQSKTSPDYTTYYLAFDFYYNLDSAEGHACGEDGHAALSEMILLESEGVLNQVSPEDLAKDILDWMDQIEQKM